jgi:hypothetical protein
MVRDAGLVTELETHAPMTREELEAVAMHRKATGRINGVQERNKAKRREPERQYGETAVGGALAAKLSEYDRWCTGCGALFRT